jgi:phenylpropionate dioxygenase-like ring-hydroxylating dioxygenase large terminal subunit
MFAQPVAETSSMNDRMPYPPLESSTTTNQQPMVVNQPEALNFQVHRRTLVDPAILELEQRRIFDVCWLYAGHESEVPNPGDFKTRVVCGRPIILCRGDDGKVRVFLNSCRHRGAIVAREAEGNTRSFFCFYHGWSYDRAGKLDGVPGVSSYPSSFRQEDYALAQPPRVDGYRGFIFINFDAQAMDLIDYLAGATEYIDLIIDQSPSGQMEIIRGVQEYDIRANWKLLVENSFDDYHLLTTHSTWLDYMRNSGVEMKRPERGHLLPAHGIGKPLGNGHAVIDNVNFRGRPVAKWIPIYGEEAKPEIERIRAELVARLGEARATRVADTNRNLVIFPNLVINDGSAVTVRSFQPDGAGGMKVRAWAMGPKDETAQARAIRLDAFLTFYGPGGFATPDDVEALEMVQMGLATWREVPWSVMTRGMEKQGEQLNTDELHLRSFWLQWDKLMQGAKPGQ